ncbi:sodium channel modifier 1 isoform X1 [Salmo trutta]|uniref:Sodium channel modifier 1 n=2 Tax=Salmo trutta TaxID=8032 RepID=A0A673VL15_SALTR|nr:sodium channel modifier 1-like isoform X1 [Salmo trutta]
MSFKRDGNDQSQLYILKKRRVADLLSNFIPEDEAALMKNGRYTCLVCSYRPVFDTVDMLTVHRKGKRHLEGMKWFYGKKTQLKNEISKRKHENYVQAEDSQQEPSSSAPLLTQTRKLTHHALLKTVPYNSCLKKTSTKSEKGSASSIPDCDISPSNTRPSSPHQTSVETIRDTDIMSLPSSNSNTAVNQGSCPIGRNKEVCKESQPTATQESEPMTAQRRREMEHYLKLKSAGWLQDRSGQWVKDENVEFDSDEEEPSLLPSSPPTDSTEG